jgi:hypothetical protein
MRFASSRHASVTTARVNHPTAITAPLIIVIRSPCRCHPAPRQRPATPIGKKPSWRHSRMGKRLLPREIMARRGITLQGARDGDAHD